MFAPVGDVFLHAGGIILKPLDSSKGWEALDQDAKDILESLLHDLPERRLSATAVLHIPWLYTVQGKPLPQEPIYAPLVPPVPPCISSRIQRGRHPQGLPAPLEPCGAHMGAQAQWPEYHMAVQHGQPQSVGQAEGVGRRLYPYAAACEAPMSGSHARRPCSPAAAAATAVPYDPQTVDTVADPDSLQCWNLLAAAAGAPAMMCPVLPKPGFLPTFDSTQYQYSALPKWPDATSARQQGAAGRPQCATPPHGQSESDDSESLSDCQSISVSSESLGSASVSRSESLHMASELSSSTSECSSMSNSGSELSSSGSERSSMTNSSSESSSSASECSSVSNSSSESSSSASECSSVSSSSYESSSTASDSSTTARSALDGSGMSSDAESYSSGMTSDAELSSSGMTSDAELSSSGMSSDAESSSSGMTSDAESSSSGMTSDAESSSSGMSSEADSPSSTSAGSDLHSDNQLGHVTRSDSVAASVARSDGSRWRQIHQSQEKTACSFKHEPSKYICGQQSLTEIAPAEVVEDEVRVEPFFAFTSYLACCFSVTDLQRVLTTVFMHDHDQLSLTWCCKYVCTLHCTMFLQHKSDYAKVYIQLLAVSQVCSSMPVWHFCHLCTVLLWVYSLLLTSLEHVCRSPLGR